MSRSQLSKVTVFSRMLQMLGADNCMQVKAMENWPEFLDYTYINSQLKKLNPQELEEFTNGELDNQIQITNKHNIQDISILLNLIFDSELNDYFFE